MSRTDADSWDVASSVGATATMVAAARAVASRQPDPLITDPFAVALVRAVGIDFFTRFAEGELNLADVDKAGTAELIVDITTTGTTLAANHLKVLEDGLILQSQAHLFAARGAQWTKSALAAREAILDRLSKAA